MKRSTNPLSIDFSALKTLRLVHGHQSFSRAAESLETGQSTVSYSIEKLRLVFNDPLFVRQGGKIVPTQRCNEIVVTTSKMLDDFSSLTEAAAFDPSKAEATITISCNYYERTTMVPKLMTRLRSVAPGLKIKILSSTVRGKEQLDRGESDLLIGPVKIADGSYYRRHLTRDHYVCVMGPSNPLRYKTLDRETYLKAPHIVVTYGGGWKSKYVLEIEAVGDVLNIVMDVPSPAALPALLEATDLVSTIPRRVARTFGPRVHIVECPFPGVFDVDLTWTSRTHKSPMHKWLRSELAALG